MLAMTDGSSRKLWDGIFLNRQRLRHILVGMLLVCLSGGFVSLSAVENSLPVPQLVHPIVLPSTTVSLYAVSPTQKVFPHSQLSETSDLITAPFLQLAAARRESEQVQLVLRSEVPLSDVVLRFTEISDPCAEISADAWSWRRVVNTHIEGATWWYGLIGTE